MAFILYNLGKIEMPNYIMRNLKINPNLTSIMSKKELNVFNKLMTNNTKQ